MSFSQSEVLAALEQCSFVTDRGLTTLVHDPALECSAVTPFRLSSKIAVVRRADDGRTYVIFRGTESCGLGTWLITNGQAASCEFRVVDPSIQHRSMRAELSVQGVKVRNAAPGRVHQGILRTWSQLWYHTDILDATFLDPSTSPARLWVRHLVTGSVAGLFALRAGGSVPLAMLCAVTAALLVMAIESGSLERMLWKRRPPIGRPLSECLESIGPNRQLTFVGHSLGGALATLAFAVHRSRCAEKGESDSARLITFASPLVGDKAFVEDFEQRHRGRYLHVVDSGDLVTFAPPSDLRGLLTRARASILSCGGILAMLASLWWTCIYRWLWEGQTPYCNWSSTHRHELGRGYRWISILRHSRKAYRRQLMRFPLDNATAEPEA